MRVVLLPFDNYIEAHNVWYSSAARFSILFIHPSSLPCVVLCTVHGRYESFSNLCTNLDVHSLVMALHTSHCWYCGDGQQDPDEECDGGACAMA